MNTNKQQYLQDLGSYLFKTCGEFAPIIIRIPRRYMSGDYTCRTDGKVVKLGDKFFELTLSEQIYKTLHICLHLALRHHQRARDLETNDVALGIWNVATDSVIVHALKDYVEQKLAKTENFSAEQFTFTLVKEILEEEGLNLTDMNAETVFSELIKRVDVIYSPQPQGGGADNNEEDEEDKKDNENKDKYEEYKEQTLKQLKEEIDKIENEFNFQDFEDTPKILKEEGMPESNREDSQVQDLIWGKIVQDTLSKAGDIGAKLLVRLQAQLPKVKVPWSLILREFLLSRLLPEKESNWRRPSRKVLAGTSEFFEPHRDRKKGIRKLALCWDISGSCFSPRIISKFVANIDSIRNLTQCGLVVIPFDVEVDILGVRTLSMTASLQQLLSSGQLEVNGGGGTDFRPPIEYASSINPDVIVVLTDCQGPFPEAVKIPTLWASTSTDKAPWGRTIFMEED